LLGGLDDGLSRVISWKIHVKDQCASKKDTIRIILRDEYSPLDTCTAVFNIPANDLHSLNLSAEPANAGRVTKEPDKDKYECNEPITITATWNTGFKFIGWEGDFSGDNMENPKRVFLDTDKDKYITARFIADSFSLNINVNPIGAGNTTPSIGVHRYRNGDNAEISYTPDPCYTFLRWSGDTTSTNDRLSVTMYKDMNIIAEFAIKNFTVSEEKEGIGNISMTPPSSGNGRYDCGTIITITATPGECYAFEKWEIKMDGIDTTITQNPVTSPIFGDVSIKAHFVIRKVTLTTSANINAAVDTIIISPRKNEYDCGDMVTLTVVPDPCYNFLYWSDGNTSNPRTITMNEGDVNYEAVLAIKRVTIKSSTNVPNSGTTTTIPQIDTCDCGTTVLLSVTSDGPYDFAKWSDGDTNRTRDITIKSDTNITANMARISLNVTKSEPNIFPNIVVTFQIDSTWWHENGGVLQSHYFSKPQFTVIDEDSVGNSNEIKNFNLVDNQIVYSLYGNCYDEYTDLKRKTIVKFVRHGYTYIDTAMYNITINAGCDSCSRLLQWKAITALKQNRPNPYNPETRIGYSIAENDHVFIVVYDILGREVAILVNEYKEAGEYGVIFRPHALPSGVYFYKMKTSTFQAVRKMSFIK
jgi:hypothetical protein